jgi:hypothetical protein
VQQAKPNPSNEPLDPDVLEKLGKIFLMISSPNEREALTALRMLNHALEANGIDHHTLVARMAKPWLSDSAKEQFKSELANARIAGRVEGMREVEAKRGLEDDFSNTDGSSNWREVARFVGRERHRLPARSRDAWNVEFIDNMVALAASPLTSLSPKRATHLYNLFGKLGGKIT